MNENKAVRIASIDAKDLYGVIQNGCEYNVKLPDGKPNYKKYINTFDYSIDLIKLREIYSKLYRRNDFGFFENGKEYTNHIINVTFKYAYKLYNKCGKNLFLKNGYTKKNLNIVDCVCIIDNEIVAIEIGKPININQLNNVNTKYFKYNADKNVYELASQMPLLMDKKLLRNYLYDNGFTIGGIKYVRFKRSSGSARVGKCLFINQDLYERIHKWDLCGLKVKDGDDIDLAAFEASISLTSSSIIDTVAISPANILVIDDYEDEFEDEVVTITLENGRLEANAEKVKIKNNIWDGQSLIDKSFFEGKYSKYGMLLLRNRHFKSNGINTNIQKWFKDNDITDVKQLNGFTLAKDLTDIKVITTPSSIKYLKFGSLQQWLKNLDTTFGIVKHDKPTYYFDGRMVQSHYQLLNTLQLSYTDMQNLLKPTLDYISHIKTDPAVLRYHIRYPYNDPENLQYDSKNDIVFGLMGINNNFAKTTLYQDFKKDLVKSLVKNLRRGHVLINGNYSTLFGNGLEMLKFAVGKFGGKTEIGVGNIYSKAFKDGETLLGSRSPHTTMGNIYLATNKYISEYDKYFNLSKEIVCVNAIGENLQQRLNGCDYDSDSMILTNHSLFIEKAKKNYNKFLVPTSLVQAEKTKRKYNSSQQSELDVKTSVNKIGEIINLSQELNSRLWNNIHNGQPMESNMELYYDICKLSVLSGIEIDKAKKEFLVDSVKEIGLLKSKYKLIDKNGKTIKPMFFKMITTENGYELNPKNEYKYFDTPMDYLQKIISEYTYKSRNEGCCEIVPLSSIIKTIPQNTLYGRHYRQRDKVIENLRAFKNSISEMYSKIESNEAFEKESRLAVISDIKNKCVSYINSIVFTEKLAYLMLMALEDFNYRDIKMFVFRSIFNSNNNVFWDLVNKNKNDIEIIQEQNRGDLRLYDFEFCKK